VIRSRVIVLVGVLGLAAAGGRAQDWTIGATYGLANDIENRFRLDAFTPHEITAWVDYRLEPRTLLRTSYVDITTSADRSLSVPDSPPPQPIPTRPISIHALTVGVSYLAWEGFFTSGIFAGIGGYRIVPDSNPDLAPYLDVKETAFGFHAGVDGDLRLTRHISAVGRLTLYGILSRSKRWIFAASVGLAAHL
jgi:hypothetical protein